MSSIVIEVIKSVNYSSVFMRLIMSDLFWVRLIEGETKTRLPVKIMVLAQYYCCSAAYTWSGISKQGRKSEVVKAFILKKKVFRMSC